MAKENFIITEEQNTAIATPVEPREEQYNAFSVLSDIKIDKFIKTLYDGTKYLPWSSAWGLVKEHFPTANYRIIENDVGWNFHVANGEGYVKVGVTIQGLEHIVTRPIYGGKNASKKVEQITQADVNKAQQRALTKCCAMHGLALQLWSSADEIDWSCGDATLPKNLQPQGLPEPASTGKRGRPSHKNASDVQIPSPSIPAPAPVATEEAPSAPAPVTSKEQPKQNVSAPAPVTSATVTYSFPGDGKSIVISDREEPLVFKTVENYREEDIPRMLKTPFSMNDEIFVDAGVIGIQVRDALNRIIGHHNTEALKVLSEKLEGFDFEKAEQSELPASMKAALYAISCVLHKTLSTKKENF